MLGPLRHSGRQPAPGPGEGHRPSARVERGIDLCWAVVKRERVIACAALLMALGIAGAPNVWAGGA
jgi:hypothetical protein